VGLSKTAAPSPAAQGNLLTYTLIATNNGPASATNVTVVDVLPASLQFVSVVTTAGTCSQAANTVTCQLGTIASAATATINIVVTPQSAAIVTNSATVIADQTDPTPANNVATVTTLVTAPTRIHLQSFTAEASTNGIRWTFAPMLDIARDPRWGRIVDVLNVPLYQEWKEDTKIALGNIKSRLKYTRLDEHGPRSGEITREYVASSN